ncbi:ATP-binding cassette domain-containing protein [Pseudolysobacter antarcticus]|uniref:ATP-binding cassette domain-containing protein n=1 Tax=Pseudolysobacter antarcticus TaxID=2511995 RepID=A0A411HEQ6_9GAMM|nr:ATP-binding cassette domain-containing protein [Pseudolysobacter antarcticus]QBB68973.1 ATP-binding cassette domain-containing protein [Pseudolysobacter antarcticus]
MFQLDNVSKYYGTTLALEGVTLEFPRGSISALIGSSGSGKSTVLRLLLGLERADSGVVRIDGVPLQNLDLLALRRGIGYVIQDGGLFPHLSAYDNLALLPQYVGWPKTRIEERIEILAALTHFPRDGLQRYPLELSGGQRQRVALMRALMLDPLALLLDEPLSALDPIVRYELQDELAAIFTGIDKTVVLVTHDLAEAAFLAPRLILLDAGKVQQSGDLDALRHTPANAWVERFVHARRDLTAASA